MESYHRSILAAADAGEILGYRLQPFTLAHYEALVIVHSPYVTQARDPLWEDVEMALCICSRQRPIDDLPAISRFRRLRWRLMRPKMEDQQEAAFSVGQWVAECTAQPQAYVDPHDDRPARRAVMPWILRVVRALCTQYGMTHDEAWHTPFQYSMHLYLTWAESEGERLADREEDAAILEELERIEAEKRARLKGVSHG